MSDVRPVALITGASSGIGFELSRLFARDGYDLVLVARSPEGLERAARSLRAAGVGAVRTLAVDLAEADAVDRIVAALEEDGRPVQALVNNAGFGTEGSFAGMPEDTIRGMLQVNVVALTLLTRRLLPGMLARRSGQILNVASTAAFQPGPLMDVYYASKAYVLSFSEALSVEVAGSGVTVTALCPGLTRTNFQRRAGIQGSRLANLGLSMSAEAVARAGYRALQRGQRVVVPGLTNQLSAAAIPLLPRRLLLAAVRRLHEPRSVL